MFLLARLFRSIEIRCGRFRNRARSACWKALISRAGGSVGAGFLLRGDAFFDSSSGSRVTIGKEVTIAEGAAVYVGPRGRLELGDRVFIGRNSVLVANQELRIGPGTQIAHGVTVIDTDHSFEDPSVALSEQGERSASIRIGSEVWIGAQAIVLKGRTLGDRCVIGAGSVVTKDVSPGTVVAGNPARELR